MILWSICSSQDLKKWMMNDDGKSMFRSSDLPVSMVDLRDDFGSHVVPFVGIPRSLRQEGDRVLEVNGTQGSSIEMAKVLRQARLARQKRSGMPWNVYPLVNVYIADIAMEHHHF